jgi:N-acetylglutamate synthase-like GNAT family acetyltransferase
MIRPCTAADIPAIFDIVNDAALAYKGIIPADCWHEPYMPLDELQSELADGVAFWGFEREGSLVGVMGIQDKGDVALVRHAYVRTNVRRGGIGAALLSHLETLTRKDILIGTWAAATWAIAFYRKNGYALVNEEQKNRLLRRYWSITERQVATSVVLEKRGRSRP